jgi:hypothetical protein
MVERGAGGELPGGFHHADDQDEEWAGHERELDCAGPAPVPEKAGEAYPCAGGGWCLRHLDLLQFSDDHELLTPPLLKVN